LEFFALSLASVGVVLSTQNVNSICTTTKALGNTALTVSAASQFTGGSTGTAAPNSEIIARLNLIENAINGYATPSC
jgi:hypothetical protein